MTDEMLKEIGVIVGGVSGIMSIVVFLASNLVTARIKESVKNEYEKNRQQEQHDRQIYLEKMKQELLVGLEREKLKHSLIIHRSEIAKDAISQITDHCYDISNNLAKKAVNEVVTSEQYKSANLASEKNRILLEFIASPTWAEWRQKYQALRSRLESTNEILSRYSVQMETILHPDTMKKIISNDLVLSSEKKVKHGDYRYILSSTWRLIGDCLNALGKLSATDERFWMLSESKENYGRKLDKWVVVERENIVDTLKQFSAAKGMCDWHVPEVDRENFIFYMKIEEDKGINEFWQYIENSPNSTLQPSLDPSPEHGLRP